MSSNGAVMLGHEMRLRLPPAHLKSLGALARHNGWKSQTALAEALLTEAIERAARLTSMAHVLRVIARGWPGGLRVNV